MVEVFHPKSLDEALAILKAKEVTIIAGGTDLMVKKRRDSGLLPNFEQPLLFVHEIPELNMLYHESDQIVIGASVSLQKLLEYNATPKLLKKAISQMASPAVRHVGTLGGNVGNGSPAGDTLPVLAVLDASVIIENTKQMRMTDIQSLIIAPGRLDMKNDELIKGFIIKDIHNTQVNFVKVGGRKSDAISKVSFAGLMVIEEERIKKFRVAFGAVGPTIVRSTQIETSIRGLTLEELIKEKDHVLNAYKSLLSPIDDQRSTAQYRMITAINLLADFIDSKGGVSR